MRAAAVISVAIVLAGANVADRTVHAQSESPRAVVAQTEHDFGTVTQGARLSHAFVIRNEGTAPLTISRIDLSLPGTKTRFKKVIAPAESAAVAMEWDTSTVQGEFEAHAIVHVNDPARPTLWLGLKATVKGTIEFVPFPEVFFSAYRGETPERTVQIVSNADRPMRITGVEAPSGRYELAVDTVKDGSAYDVRVKVRPDVPFGRFTGEPIYVHTDSPERPRLQLRANLLVKPDFYAAPEEVNFGTVRLDSLLAQPELVVRTRQSITLSNRQGPVEIERIESDIPGLQITRTPSTGPEQRFRLDVALMPQKVERGAITGSIRVVPADPAVAPLIIPVRGEIR